MGYEEQKIEGRNAVLEAFRSGKTIDKLFVLDGCQDGPVRTIVREARKHDTIINFVDKERLDQLSETKKHQGVIAVAAAYEYWIISKIRTILVRSSVPQIWREHTAWSFQNAAQWDLPQRLQRLLQVPLTIHQLPK